MPLYLYLFGMLFPVHPPQQAGPVAAAMVYPPCGAGLKSHLHKYLSQDVQGLQVMLFDGCVIEPVGLLPTLPQKQLCAIQQFGPYVFGLCDFFRRAGELGQTGSSSQFGQIISHLSSPPSGLSQYPPEVRGHLFTVNARATHIDAMPLHLTFEILFAPRAEARALAPYLIRGEYLCRGGVS